jgi:hypothetical protein
MKYKQNNASFAIEQSAAEIAIIDQLAQSLGIHTRFIIDNIIIKTKYLAPSTPNMLTSY